MKKIILFILLIMPMAMLAQKNDSKYLAGAVPQDENGLVVWSQSLKLTGKTQTEIYDTLNNWVQALGAEAIKDVRTRQIDAQPNQGLIVWRIEEWMIFKRRALLLDRARFRYQISIECQNEEAKLTIRQISYYYDEDERGENGTIYKAEEWITDKEALNKKKTKLYKYSAKFRRVTVDRVEEIFKSAKRSFSKHID